MTRQLFQGKERDEPTTKDEFDAKLPWPVPSDVEVCPICGADLVIDEVSEWYEHRGQMRVNEESSISVDCTTAPDIDSEDFDDFMTGHWSTPYIDWMPVQQKVARWLRHEVQRTKRSTA